MKALRVAKPGRVVRSWGVGRKCKCGTVLSRYNRGSKCALCSRTVRDEEMGLR